MTLHNPLVLGFDARLHFAKETLRLDQERRAARGIDGLTDSCVLDAAAAWTIDPPYDDESGERRHDYERLRNELFAWLDDEGGA